LQLAIQPKVRVALGTSGPKEALLGEVPALVIIGPKQQQALGRGQGSAPVSRPPFSG